MVSIREIEVSIRGKEIDLTTGLSVPDSLEFLGVQFDSEIAKQQVAEEVPSDGREVVNWMHDATGANSVLYGIASDYSNAGGELLSVSNDAYIPGVSLRRISFVSHTGTTVRNRGYAELRTPEGTYRVPYRGRTIIAKNKLLAMGIVPAAWYIQYIGIILQWTKLAKSPITDRIRFSTVGGNSVPIFVNIASRIPAPVITVRLGFTSIKSQNVKIIARETDKYHNIYFEDTIEVPEGESEALVHITGFPVVPKLTLQLDAQPHIQSTLDYVDTIP